MYECPFRNPFYVSVSFLCILFKNFSNLSLNSSGTYLYNSELMFSSPGLLPFFINFKAFSNSSDFVKASLLFPGFHSNFGSFMFVVFHNFSSY